MRVSPWLQRKFDASGAENRKQINQTLKNIRDDIHPEFYASFESFRKELKAILKAFPAANDNAVLDELTDLSDEVKRTNGEYNTKVWAAIIDKAA